MKEVLTNEEIDALLDLFESEGAPDEETLLAENEAGPGGLTWGGGQPLPDGPGTPAPPRQKMVSRFDLFRPNRFTREQIQYLGNLQEVTALGISSTIAEKLRLEGQCDCVLVEQNRFATFLGKLIQPIALYNLTVRPTGHKALIAFTCPMLFSAIDRIMGGTGVVDIPDRDLTDVEYAVVNDLVQSVLMDIAGGFRDLTDLELVVDSQPRNKALAQVLGSQDVILSLQFQISGDPMVGDIMLAIPHEALAADLVRIDQAGGGSKSEGPSYRKVITEQVIPTPIEMSVELGQVSLNLRDLLGLKRGDVLVLENQVGGTVTVPIEGVPKYTGVLGTRGRRLAVRLAESLGGNSNEGEGSDV